MKRIFYTLSLIALTFGVHAQWIINDDFTSSPATVLTTTGWTVTQANVTNPISVVSPGLSFTDYLNSGLGNAAALANNGQDIYIGGTGVSADSAYCSAMINVSAAQATGDYFFAMLPNNSSTNFIGRIFIKSTSGGYLLGLAKGSSGTAYGSTVLSLNTTYAIVCKYAFRSGNSTDDEVSLYVFTTSMPASEPLTAEVGPISGTTDAPNISRIVLRQGNASNAPTMVVDGARLGTPWSTGYLPVTYKTFNVIQAPDANILRWTTASESNNSHFDIQRSADGKNFETIGKVKGHGNSMKVNAYQYSDNAYLTAKTIYYRLKQVDYDGKFELSKTISISNTATKAGIAATLPNPFNDELSVTISSGSATTATIELMDMIGKLHHTAKEQLVAGSNIITINTTDMPDGIYFVRLNYNGETFTQKVIKK